MDIVVGLFGYHGHVSRFVEVVTASSVFMCVMIFERQTRYFRWAQECACADGLRFELRHFGESIVIVVIAVAVSRLTEDEDAGLIVVGNNRRIHCGVVVECARESD